MKHLTLWSPPPKLKAMADRSSDPGTFLTRLRARWALLEQRGELPLFTEPLSVRQAREAPWAAADTTLQTR